MGKYEVHFQKGIVKRAGYSLFSATLVFNSLDWYLGKHQKKFKAPDGSKVARVDSPLQWVLVKGVVWSGQICAEAWSSDGARGEGFQRCSIDKDWARGSMEMVWCRDWNRSTDGDLKAGPSSSWCWMAKLEIAVGSAAGDGG
nr:bifunctional nitrilase/nitrile hydratase nit4 [Quercus suber]